MTSTATGQACMGQGPAKQALKGRTAYDIIDVTAFCLFDVLAVLLAAGGSRGRA